MTAGLIKNPSRLRFMRQEALRVAGWTPELASYLRRHRIDMETSVAHCGYIIVAMVRFMGGNSGDANFEFDVDGSPAVVIEALLYDMMKVQFTADLVAWSTSCPDTFSTAMGINDGADLLGVEHMVQRAGRPLAVYRTPLSWLQAGCIGCVPLKPGARHWLHRAGGPFIAEDVDHGRELRDLLGIGASRHRILVPQTPEAA